MSYVAATIQRHWAKAITLAIVIVASMARAADEHSSQTQSTDPLHFQRVLVPADQPDQWPRDKSQRYLPMATDEFERRVRQLAEQKVNSINVPAARLIKAEYAAELIDDDLTAGTATWQFEHHGTKRELVLLENCRLAIGEAEWIDSKQPALLGNDAQGRLAAVVEAPGKMRCSWSLRGQRNAAGQRRFELLLPTCAVNVVELTLPAELLPIVDHGIVSPAEQTTPNADRRKWRIDLGGHFQIRLRIAPQEPPRSQHLSPIVRSHYDYECSEQGLELNAEFRIQPADDSVSQFSLLVDRALTVVSAEMDDVELPVAGGAIETDGFQRVTLNLAGPLSGRERRLRVSAVAPLKHGMLNGLPLMRMANARWQQGTASLVVASPLVLEDLRTADCRRIAANSAAVSSRPQAIEFQFYNDLPRIDFQLAPNRDRVEVNCGTSIQLRSNQAIGHWRGEFTASAGQHFVLEAELAPRWTIDTVEALELDPRRNALPPSAPEDYVPQAKQPVELVKDWSIKAQRGKRDRLIVELQSALTPQRGIGIKITGHRRRASNREALNIDGLRMLEFADTTPVRRLVQVQAAERLQIQPSGDDDLRRLAIENLSPSDAALLDRAPSGMAFHDDEGARSLSVFSVAQDPKFSAVIRGDILATDSELSESYRFTVTPESQEIDRLLVHFTQPRDETLRWHFVDDPGVEVTSRRLTSEDQAAQRRPDGEIWEIKLPVAHSKKFILQADRSRAFHGDTPIALASLLKAESQEGSVQIRSSGFNAPEIRSRRLKSIPIEPAAAGQISNVLAALRYDPGEARLVSAEPQLILVPRLEKPATVGGWIWNARLQSRYRSENAEHLLTCRVENSGRDQILFQLPAGAELRGAWIDDRAVLDPTRADPQRCQIKLPAGARFIIVAVQWIDEQSRLSHLSQITSPWPECNVPVLARDWVVSLPPGVQIAAAELANHRGDESWLPRLFGPLVRAGIPPILPSIAAGDPKPADRGDRPVDNAASSVSSLAVAWRTDLSDRFAQTTGWATYQFDSSSSSAVNLRVVHEQSSVAWFWAVFAMVAAIRWAIGPRRLSVEIGLLTTITALALIVPASWTTFSPAIWLGAVAAQLLIWICPQVAGARASTTFAERSSLRRGLATAGTATAMVLALCRALASAQELPAARAEGGQIEIGDAVEQAAMPNSAARGDHALPAVQILVPIGQNGKLHGNLYYLPESFHRRLSELNDSHETSLSQYLITSAAYQGDESRGDANKEPSSGAWKAIYEIESLAIGASAELPIGFNGAALEPNGVLLDGKPADFSKVDTSDALRVDLPTVGRHRLEILFRPQRNVVGLDFTVPTVSNAQIRLATRGGMAPQFTTAIGVKQSNGRDDFTVQFGPTPRIIMQEAVAAEHATASTPAAAQFECDVLGWLRVEPGRVIIDARFRLRVQRGRLSQIRLAVDPRLKLLPLAEGPTVLPFRATENEQGSLIVEWLEPVAGQTAIDLSFVLADATGVGNLYFPAVEPRGGQIVRKFWATSVDPALAIVAHHPTTSSVPVEDFSIVWGASTIRPQLALAEAKGPLAGAYITVRPVTPKMTAHYQVAAIAEANSVAVHFLAKVAGEGAKYQFNISLPAEFQVEGIFAGNRDDHQPLHWNRSRLTAVTVFLDEPATGEQTLVIHGRLPLGRSGRVTLPDIRLDGHSCTSFDCLILRRAESLVRIADDAGAKAAAQADSIKALVQAWEQNGVISNATANDSRVVAALTGGNQYRPVAIDVRRNSPRTIATQLTTLSRRSDGWHATVGIDVQVRDGLLDELRFDLPTNWIGPFEMTPNLAHQIEEPVASGSKQLVIRPDFPIAESLRLEIAGPILVAANRRLAAPQLRLHGAKTQSDFFLLPRRYEQEQLLWETPGLADTQWPTGLPPAKVDLRSHRFMTKAAESYRAELRSIDRGVGNGQVLLADYSVATHVDGSSIGVAAFDLELPGATNCLLELPEGAELISVRLDRAPAQLLPLTENRWSIWFGDSNLPRRLDVIYRQSTNDDFAQHDVLRVPRLVDLPIERTLWTIDAPASMGTVAPRSGSAIATTEHGLLRLECTASLLKSADRLLTKEPDEYVGSWYRPWAERLQLRRMTAARRSTLDPQAEAEDRVKQSLTTIDNEQSELAHRLGVQEVLDQSVAGVQVVSEPGTLLESLQPATSIRSHIMLAGNAPELEIDFPERSTSEPTRRMLAAIAVGLVGLTLTIVTRRKNTSLGDIPYFPAAVGAVAGLVWWLWLSPAILGPVIIFACTVSAWRCAQIRSSAPAYATPLGSTVTRAISPANSSQFRSRPR